MEHFFQQILNELNFLINSRYFQSKLVQKKFLKHFHAVYHKHGKIVSITANELVVAIYQNDKERTPKKGEGYEHWKNLVAVQVNTLRQNLETFYKDEGNGRTVIRIPKREKGSYVFELAIPQQNEDDMEGVNPEEARSSGVLLGKEKVNSTVDPRHSVDETILLTVKGMDVKRLSKIKWIATAAMWGSALLGLSVLIVLLIGFPYWPNKPVQGLVLTAVLLLCVCMVVLTRPITRLPDIPFNRWWGNIFCLHRRGALMLVRYSGMCAVDGCGGSLSVVCEEGEMANLFDLSVRRWILVCTNVPSEHPRMPFDFTASDRNSTDLSRGHS